MLIVLNTLLSALIIGIAAWLSRRYPVTAGFLIALPVATLLVLPLAYLQHKDPGSAFQMARSILVALPITVLFDPSSWVSGVAGAAGLEPTTPGFGDQCSAKLSYAPTSRLRLLLRLAVKCMTSTARAVTPQLDATGIVPLVLLRRIGALLALSASKRDDGAIFGFCHCKSSPRPR